MFKRIMSKSPKNIYFSALIFLLALGSPVFGLDSDREQPLQITADMAIRDELARETRYEGNVVLTQGSLRIEADRIAISHDESDADTIVASGRPTKLVQQPALDQAPVDASANRIEFVRSESLVRLLGQARIEQRGSILSGDQIDYLLALRTVRAAGNVDGKGDGRVEVVIPPENLRGTQSSE